MQFIKKSAYHADSECGRYTINRANNGGGAGSYMAVRNAGQSILSVTRFDDDATRADAYRAAVQACEADAA